DGPGVLDLLALVSAGALTYVMLIAALWLLSGRPRGAEALLLDRYKAWRGQSAAADPDTRRKA
ncbi:MAG: hypothetical protein Q8N51_01745, partial [Gammaproteobacteria bacterium]|nr:hypothetical protein [Gammaproteobacteria bacterium]